LAFQSPDATGTGGIYLLVLQGGVDYQGQHYPEWSVMFVAQSDGALALTAGARGAELLALRFDSQND
jgi:hypothetical protein